MLWKRMNRRHWLALVSAVFIILITPKPKPISSTESDADKLMTEKLNGIIAKTGKITLDIPEISENGASVQFAIAVDSPMTNQSYVKVIHILAEGNPAPLVASYYFTPYSGKAQITSRMRLAQKQYVRVLAIMNDSSAYLVRKEVKVVSGGCG